MKLSEELKRIERELKDACLELLCRDRDLAMRVLGEARRLRKIRKYIEDKGLEA